MPSRSPRKPTRAATLADVGREAGVSAMAVSAVLNGARTSSRTAPDTRERILAAAEKLRYRPNAAARALAERRMNTVGVATVVEGSGLNQYFLEVFNGVIESSARAGQSATVFALHDWDRDLDRLPAICDGRIDGLILIGPTFPREALARLPDHTPFVCIHSNHVWGAIVNLESDEEKGAFDATTYLIDLGHRRIMHLAGPENLLGAQRRVRGYKRALAKARIRFDANLLVSAGYSTESGMLGLQHWLADRKHRLLPQAIFCANDALAIAAIEVLGKIGCRVPDDVSIIGFDDTLSARTTVPQLTTVRQPLRELGTRAVEVLLDRIDIGRRGGDQTGKNVVLPTELVVRSSVGRPPEVDRAVPTL